jgi:hypothetical protein
MTYLSFAFVIWEYNPMYWYQQDRFMFVMLLVFINIILWFKNLLIKDLKK